MNTTIEDDSLAVVGPRYRLCWAGFTLAAMACGVLAFDSALMGLAMFTHEGGPELRLRTPEYLWMVSTAVAWCGLLGSVLLVGRWREASWRVRTQGLVLAAMAGVVLWACRFADRLGLIEGEPPYAYLAMHGSIGIRWVWLALVAGLAADVAVHLGRSDARSMRGVAQSLVMAGAAIWIALLLSEGVVQAARAAGRVPLRLWMMLQLELLGLAVLRCGASFVVTVVALLAARECSIVLREMRVAEASREALTGPISQGDRLK